MRKILFLLFFLFIAIGSSLTCSWAEPTGSEPAQNVLAAVNGSTITASELDRWMADHPPHDLRFSAGPNKGALSDEILDAALSDYIDFVLLKQAAQEHTNIEPKLVEDYTSQMVATYRSSFTSEAEFKRFLADRSLTLKDFKNRIKEHFTIQDYVHQILLSKLAISDNEIRAAFDTLVTELKALLEFRSVTYLALPANPTAAETQQKNLKDSVAPFRDYVRNATAESPLQVGGNLGNLSTGKVHPEIEQLLRTVSPGKPVGPLQTPYGELILELEGRSAPPTPEYSIATQIDLERDLLLERARSVLAGHLAELRSKAAVKLHHR